MTKRQRKTLENHIAEVEQRLDIRVALPPLVNAIKAALARIDALEAGQGGAPIWTSLDCPACGQPMRAVPLQRVEITSPALVCPACGSGNTDRPNPHTRPRTGQCFKCGHQWEAFDDKEKP